MTPQDTKNILDAIKSRRSIRKYKKTPVPQELIDRVIEAGTYAATGKSQQPWLVVQVTDEATKDRIRRANALIMGKSEGLSIGKVHELLRKKAGKWKSVSPCA